MSVVPKEIKVIPILQMCICVSVCILTEWAKIKKITLILSGMNEKQKLVAALEK